MSPGNNKIPNKWLKAFTAIHGHITESLNILTEEPKQMPDWLTRGTTHILPK
jgi:hypothetical protein